ncbi:MAG: histidine kinase [Rhodothermales bacterium]|nr:histidine kinase [Rhodothermales bacterium]
MAHRVQDILLVSSSYESFILSEDGQLEELILSQFLELNLHHPPDLTHISTGEGAIELALSQDRYNLIITTIQVGDMDALALARKVKEAGLDVPVILLAFDNRELKEFLAHHDVSDIERIFLWQGDIRILLAIVKFVEDRWNADFDCDFGGVQVVLVVEDSIRYYSSFLPLIYTEIVKHSQRLISEGLNLSHKILRSRARPKILLCASYEEAWQFFTRHAENVLGIISDVEFPKEGVLSKTAGLELAARVKADWKDVPVLLQSSRAENSERAREVGADFLQKGSSTLLTDLRQFMVDNFGLGDFIFRTPDGHEVGRAHDMKSLEDLIRTVPVSSIGFHGERNHFSKWLKSRTEFDLAHRLRPRKVSDYDDVEDLRKDLVSSISMYRKDRHRGTIADFDPLTFDAENSFSRIGGGSLGGKARGLAYVRHMLDLYWDGSEFPGIRASVPPAVVVGTDVFDHFLDSNDLRDFAMSSEDDLEIERRFLGGHFPEEPLEDLRDFIGLIRFPLAVRSSSLLEDSQYQPFTGVYNTYMLANTENDTEQRLDRLVHAIKLVYASAFSSHAKRYLNETPYRLEEEKMAVIVQKIVGAHRGDNYYPNFSGVARSYNFYPTAPMRPEDGIVAVALGMGKMVVEGGNCVRFCPKYPRHPMPFSSLDDALDGSQRTLWALPSRGSDDMHEVELDLDVAEKDGTLDMLASTFDPDNEAMFDGVSRRGVRVVTFAPVLKHHSFPLAELTRELMFIGERGMAHPVEIEFAVNVDVADGEPIDFGFLQMRPLVLAGEVEDVDLTAATPGSVLCQSTRVLGSGRIDDIHDVVVIDSLRFDRARSREAAAEVARLNAKITGEGRKYLLVGVGRWGSTDPWLGIPIAWDEISGARAIVEAGFRDYAVTPSQGTHFFQNLVSFQVGYFTVGGDRKGDVVDWEWLREQPAMEKGRFAKHIRFDQPVIIKMNGVKKEGLILKPGTE